MDGDDEEAEGGRVGGGGAGEEGAEVEGEGAGGDVLRALQ